MLCPTIQIFRRFQNGVTVPLNDEKMVVLRHYFGREETGYMPKSGHPGGFLLLASANIPSAHLLFK